MGVTASHTLFVIKENKICPLQNNNNNTKKKTMQAQTLRFSTAKRTHSNNANDGSPMSSSDVETFNGKIVYNLDGSAFIIDAGNATGSSISLTSSGASPTPKSRILAALTTSKKTTTYGIGIEKDLISTEDKTRAQSQTESDGSVDSISRGCHLSPKIHSFRVVSAQDASIHCQDPTNAPHTHKPILMCFICKLSFGNVNSFSLHANTEHSLNLQELEQKLLNREYSSAIIQRNMDEKPQISFLQPLEANAFGGNSKTSEFAEPVELSAIHSNQVIDEKSNIDDQHKERKNIDNEGGGDDNEMAKAMAAPSDGVLSSLQVAVKSTVKFGSLNSAITKTNNPSKTSVSASSTSSISSISPASASVLASTPTHSPLPAPTEATDTIAPTIRGESEDGSPQADLQTNSTDNISSSDKSTKRSKEAESTIRGTVDTSSPMVSAAASASGSVSPPHHPIESDATSTKDDILQQHLMSLQQQQVAAADGVFPPIQAQAQAQLSSFHASLAALANEQNARGVKLLTDFLQQQLNQQQQQHLLFPTICPEHPDFKGVDCKTCELIDIQHRIKSPATTQSHSQPQPQRSPNASSGGMPTSLPISPSASSVASVGNAIASSFTIGACSDHINGRPQGIDCTRCEMLLNSARLNSGVQMSTRNSCKTLKCPQCNWHYKYQETLEIHMREKHPDGESACGYCLAGQQHPRLARGESYSCGYKPYRCEICNYSTTTKGNLSIHMQSDKHLNNMQELNSSQNMVAAAAAAASAKLLLPSPSPQGAGQVTGSGAPSSSASISSGNTVSTVVSNAAGSAMGSGTVSTGSIKPKPSFRCDICSYETSVARNLRIHMTSEKHTHNMAVLQNNIKHIQALNFLQQHQQQGAAVSANASANSFLPLPEVALADLAYNQALMIQLLQQNAAAAQASQQHQHQHQHPHTANSKLSPTSPSPVSTPDQLQTPFSFSPNHLKLPQGMNMGIAVGMGTVHPTESMGSSGETSEPSPSSLPELWPTALYSCLVCDCFTTNNMDELNQHLLMDRSRQSTSALSDIMVIHNNNYICRLCNYKTNLKANFQLHSKTDKHLQKLNFINHIREGGSRNEYKLQYQAQLATNVVQLKCNCCDFHTNSIQKLSLHTQQMRHDTMRMIFQHLLFIIQQSRSSSVASGSNIFSEGEPSLNQEHNDQQPLSHTQQKALCCQLCNFIAKNLHEMVQHVKGLRHMQIEQFICLQRRSENLEMLALSEVFKVTEKLPSSSEDASFDGGLNLATTVCVGATSEVGFGNISPASVSSCSTSCGKAQARIMSPLQTVTDLNPSRCTTVFKCSHCEYFVESNKDILEHIETMHPSADSEDFISIPTNAAALQAFQTAVAAAALAAVQRCNESSTIETDPDARDTDGDCPIDIKRERLDENDDLMTNRADVQENTRFIGESVKSKDLQRHSPNTEPVSQSSGVSCPLCLESGYSEKSLLETHLVSVHSVTQDGLARLLQLVDHKAWQPSIADIASSSAAASSGSTIKDTGKFSITNSTDDFISGNPIATAACSTGGGMQGISCHQCEASFKHEEQLLQHAQQTQHFPLQNSDYLCLAVSHMSRPCFMTFPTLPIMIQHFKDSHMSLVISERHVYKYRCKQCSLAFKTQEKLTTHMLYHTMRDATKCSLCQRNFRSTQALQKHMEQTHAAECTAVTDGSPQDLSPSCSANETDKASADSKAFDFTTACPSESVAVTNENIKQSPQRPRSPLQLATQSKELRQISTFLSPNALDVPSTEQQQHFAVLTAALLKQQQQHDSNVLESDGQRPTSPAEMLRIQTKSQQQSSFENMNPQSLHGLQSLQNMQQMQQQLTASAATSGMPINPVDMLNLMQFHHLMSLNFMNLAPPLIFGANASGASPAVAGIQNNGNAHTATAATTAALADLHQTCAGTTATGDTASVNVNILPQPHVSSNNQQQLSTNQKRARTRITDDQLKILRAHFDINNSPSEESIMEMSQKANLPMKVVKHWFRNTLFKERQRNKDSPYNFNNPPSTTLNLEEYERTGQTKVTPLNDTSANAAVIPAAISTTSTAATPPTHNKNNPTGPISISTSIAASASRPTSTNSSGNISDYFKAQVDITNPKSEQEDMGGLALPLEIQIKTEPQDDNVLDSEFAFHKKQCQVQQQQHQALNFLKQQHGDLMDPSSSRNDIDNLNENALVPSGSSVQHFQNHQQQQHQQQQQQHQQQTNCFETKSESGSSDVLSRPPTPSSVAASNLYSSMNDILSQQLENMGSNMGPPKKLQITGKSFEKISSSGGSGSGLGSGLTSASASVHLESNSSNSSNSSSSTSGGKRANRTRFTDYQIKVLQEFFENNSYPKDSDLEYLSKLLLLSPRVIVVWFQNARQKQRKIYENQPNNSLYESEETKKQNINYACKKCSLVFQRYYELIRHQKNHCFKEENNKKSAKAQIAAAQIAQNLSSEDSNSSMDIHHATGTTNLGLGSQNVASAVAAAAAVTAVHSGSQQFGSSPSPQHLFSKSSSLTDFSPSTTPTPPQRERSNSLDQQRLPKFDCDKCEQQFNHLEHLREHQLMHLMNPTLFTIGHQSNQPESAYGPFGSILQSLQQATQQQNQPQQPPTKKRKYSETSSNAEEALSTREFETNTSHKKYEFLYQYFMQHETNTELKRQFLIQQQQQGKESDFELEFLNNFYQQSELKKVSNYDFLLQYYRKNNEESSKQQQSSFSASKKPTIEFLLQYYQLNESKKFFQLVASPQATPDGAGSQPPSQQPNATADEATKIIGRQEQQLKIEQDLLYFTTEADSNEKDDTNKFSQNDISAPTVPKGLVNDEHEKLNNNHINANLTDNHQCDLIGQVAGNKNERTDNINFPSTISCVDSLSGDNQISLLRNCEKSKDTEKSQYFQNLEDFLDATMIENNSQMLTFNDDDNPSPKVENITSSTIKGNDSLPLESSVQVNAPSKQNKRLRTTILPEQLNFLYECYQTESNPSRKMLEEISKKVNLKKRVVQVWFQNSRAKDKKSRNQRQYAHISDDNNSFDGSSGKEASNSNSNIIKSKSVPLVQESMIASTPHIESEADLQLLCQTPQVNMHKHAFSAEHIYKMKELLEQTSDLYAHSNASGSDDNDSDREKRFYSLSKAFLLQHMVSNVSNSIVPPAGTGSNYFDASESESATATTTAATDDSSDGLGKNTNTSAGAHRHMAGDIAVSVNNDGNEMTEASRQNSKGTRDLLQQLFNRNHITVIGSK